MLLEAGLGKNLEANHAELAQLENKSSAFHIHLDGAILPLALESYAKSKYGFFNDDFDHALVVERESQGEPARIPARQLTLKFPDRYSGKNVRAICEDLRKRADQLGFAGVIQSEYIMTELVLKPLVVPDQAPEPFPFYIHMRQINPEQGEEFKTHELHLELSTRTTQAALITELARSGLSVAFGSDEISFTASGNLNQIRKIQAGITEYLARSGGYDQVRLLVEATAFHSLHQIKPQNTPMVVDRVDSLQ